MMKNHNKSLLALFLLGLFGLSACTFDGDDGKDGVDGAPGTPGQDGQDGQNGQDAGSVVSTIYKAGDVSFEIVPADNTLAGSNAFALKFTATAKNQAGQEKPLTGLNMVSIYSVTAMTNATSDGPSEYWVNNGVAAGNSSSMYCTLDGTYTSRGTTGDACTLVEDPANPGTYTGTWAHDGAAPIMNPNDDLNAPHRVFLRVYNLTDADGVAIDDKVLSTPLDYIPATGALVDNTGKDTVTDAACKQCHGESGTTGNLANIEAHHNYQSVKNCIACHNPATQPTAEQTAEGWVYDLPAMIHRIHAGEHLAGWAVQTDEWAEIKYPAPIYECTVCHSNDEGKTSWKDEPTRVACGGCHSNINFTTGAGHSEFNLAQADDSQCAACHSTGALAPVQAHRVGKQAEYANLLTVKYTGASKVASVTPGYQVVTVTAEVSLNGAPLADVADLAAIKKSAVLLGSIDANGEVHRWGVSLALTNGTLASAGVLSLSTEVTDAQATGTMYASGDMQYCVSTAGKAVSCSETDLSFGDDDWIGANITVGFFNLDGGTVVKSRYVDPDRITVTEAKCNACHSDMNYIKRGHHGVHNFDQCMDCHNNNYPGAHNGFDNKDLATSVHYYHSNDVVPYPAPATDCTVCHKDGAALFATDGGLTSGRRAIQVTGGYITPVAETCHACHISEAAVAHFKSNGAYVLDDVATTADLPVESCATCHAEGKSFGIDKFHKMQ
ncbi:OmcA/MtrC family decaheme c-type cytochrome [Shewanella fodinae]|uniref:OmcA/MtrC family decaheme c-type cytochrome n=1 Tax=Shewanella fodinae TaxID=552357 RepID=UPI00167559F0|nr:OmcA/MtrC family decaheme c-type cytochrome [Shewanella fodinae]MCL2905842.1 OmcA/MtrC family decaheme c-type cytochrome [Shewanella fodinae]